ncbi:MAG: nitronate monooxygenase family protein [Paracoccaceae bacterium]|nr:nitronate monooxygenase family protein [Paracoccaceae bacterium]
MWPDRRLLDHLGLEHPILQAPMAGTATPALAAAVSGAGGLGGIGLGEAPESEIRSAVAEVRSFTNRPFNLNFFAHPGANADPAATARARARIADFAGPGGPALPEHLPDATPGFDAARLALLLDLGPRVVSFHFGLPEPGAVAAIKAAGIWVLATATTVAEARAVVAGGADAVVAQGYEAGGHRGAHRLTRAGDGIGTLALVPQVADAVSVPVIAAGGIGDARGIAAALALGAAGVQMGSAFLLCPEAATEPARRAHVAASDGSDTVMTAAGSGYPARARRTEYSDHMAPLDGSLPPFPTLYGLSGPVIAPDQADDRAAFGLYGQAAGLAREEPAGDLVARLARETGAHLARLGRAGSANR